MAYWLDKKTIATVAHQLRKQQHKIVLTHGTFDLFHLGHAYFLQESRKKSDILIVGIESDYRIKRMKGEERPIIPLAQRAKLVTHITNVDFVFAIDEINGINQKYYTDLYQRILPNVVTFGRNFHYRKQFKEVKIEGVSYSPVHHFLSQAEISTTAIISKIKGFEKQ